MEKIHPFSVRLPELLLGEISRIATAENRSKGQVAIMAISEGLRTRGINGGEWMAITKIEVEKNAARENRVGADGSGGVCDLGGINSSGDGSGQGNGGEHGGSGKSGDHASSNAGRFIKGRVTRKKIADDLAGVVGENPACAPMGKRELGGKFIYGRPTSEIPPGTDVVFPVPLPENEKQEALAKLRGMVAGIENNVMITQTMGEDGNFTGAEWGKDIVDSPGFGGVEIDLCWRKEYNPDTGQTGACGLEKGHKGKCGAWEVVE